MKISDNLRSDNKFVDTICLIKKCTNKSHEQLLQLLHFSIKAFEQFLEFIIKVILEQC